MLKVNQFQLRVIALKLIIALVFFSYSNAQGQEDSTAIKKIDSLRSVHFQSTEDARDTIHHRLLKWSKKIKYFKGEYHANIDLMIYHGNRRKKDSFDFYTKKLDSLSLVNPAWFLKYHYLTNKANVFAIFLNNPEESLACYLEIRNLIPDREKLIVYKANADINIAAGYMHKKLYDKAIRLIESRIKDSLHLNQSVKFTLYAYLAQGYENKKNGDKSLEYLKKAADLSEKEIDRVYIKNIITASYSLQGDHQKAIDSSLAVRKIIKEKYPEYLQDNSNNLANHYHKIRDLDSAIFYIKHAIDLNKDINSNELAEDYLLLSQFHEEKGDLKLSLEASKKSTEIRKSVAIEDQKTITDYYDKELTEAKNEVLHKDTLALKRSIAIGICILLVLGIVVYLHRRKRSLFFIAETKDKNEFLQNEIKLKDDQLSSLQIIQEEKTKILVKCKKELLTTNKNAIQTATKTISELLDTHYTDDTSLLELTSNAEEHKFIYRLQQKHPDLSDTDIKHCFFIYNGMSLKQTAQLLHVSVNTVKNARYRAKTRIDPPEDISFKIYLDEINKLRRISS